MSKSADELTVRPAVSSDRDQFLALWTGWQDHMGGRVPDEVTARSWRALLAPGTGLICLLVCAGDRALGFAMLSATFFAWTGEDILYLQDLFITPEARGRGVGGRLLKGIYDHADSIKARQVFWMVDEDDPELQAFYGGKAVRSPYLRYLRHPWPW